MIDLKLLEHLETYLTDTRRAKFNKVLSQRTKHFTVATEDVYQLHNTSAVIRSCDVFGIQEVNIVEERNSKRIDREIAMGAQKWVDLNRYHTVKDCINDLKAKGTKLWLQLRMQTTAIYMILMLQKSLVFSSEEKQKVYLKTF